jgi:hypothetical protein
VRHETIEAPHELPVADERVAPETFVSDLV